MRENQFPEWLLRYRAKKLARRFTASLFIFAAVIVMIYIEFRLDWNLNWTGLNKTLWDWLQLLIIPVVLAIAAFRFNRAERIAAQELATDNQRENALQTYFDRMSELILDKKLGIDPASLPVAHARTAAALRTLDTKRAASLIRFLSEANLINVVIQNELIGINLIRGDLSQTNLSGAKLTHALFTQANLSSTNLSEAILYGADFSWANLCIANLSNAWLWEANLYKAQLSGANMKRAQLRKANLRNVQMYSVAVGQKYTPDLSEADLVEANLSEADLQGGTDLSRSDLSNAILYKAKLSGTNLYQAKLIKADLRDAELKNTNLREADLSHADLRGADLSGADLNGAILSGTIISKEQLEMANSFEEIIS